LLCSNPPSRCIGLLIARPAANEPAAPEQIRSSRLPTVHARWVTCRARRDEHWRLPPIRAPARVLGFLGQGTLPRCQTPVAQGSGRRPRAGLGKRCDAFAPSSKLSGFRTAGCRPGRRRPGRPPARRAPCAPSPARRSATAPAQKPTVDIVNLSEVAQRSRCQVHRAEPNIIQHHMHTFTFTRATHCGDETPPKWSQPVLDW